MGSQRTTWFPEIPNTVSKLVLNVDLVGLPLSKVIFDKVLHKLNNSGQPEKANSVPTIRVLFWMQNLSNKPVFQGSSFGETKFSDSFLIVRKLEPWRPLYASKDYHKLTICLAFLWP